MVGHRLGLVLASLLGWQEELHDLVKRETGKALGDQAAVGYVCSVIFSGEFCFQKWPYEVISATFQCFRGGWLTMTLIYRHLASTAFPPWDKALWSAHLCPLFDN